MPNLLMLGPWHLVRRESSSIAAIGNVGYICVLHGESRKMHQPGIEPGSHRWQRCILPLDQ